MENIFIHEFALVKSTEIGQGTRINAFASVSENVIIGKNCTICESVFIGSNVVIEDECYIGPNSSIGLPAEWKGKEENQLGVIIKAGTRITGHVTIDSGSLRKTLIGTNCYLMKHSHVGHDSIVEEDVVISANATIAGHCHIMKRSNLGIGSLVHQYQKIGAYSMLGMGSVATKKSQILPGGIYIGIPAHFLKFNSVALKKYDISEDEIQNLINEFKNEN